MRGRVKAREKAKRWWKETATTKAVCDVCYGLLYPDEGYLVNGKTVARSKYRRKYVVPIVIKSIKRDFNFKLSRGDLRKVKALGVMRAKSDPEPWLLCESCFRKL